MALPRQLIRPSTLRSIYPSIQNYASVSAPVLNVHRGYATQSSLPRKSISVASDDGRVKWGELSTREKAARSTQQSFNFLLVIFGFVATAGVAVFMYKEVFSPDSKTSHFNHSANRIKKDRRVQELLGEKKQIKFYGYGDPTVGWGARDRPIKSKIEKDRTGMEHLYLSFNVAGPLNHGEAHVHMTKTPSEYEFDYRYFYVDIKGEQRIWFENADNSADKKPSGKFLGFNFNPKN